MKEAPAMAAAIVLMAILFGAVVGVFILVTVGSFLESDLNWSLYGALGGGAVGGVAALVQLFIGGHKPPPPTSDAAANQEQN